MITPLAGAGTSASILSVETSTTVSPSSTSSPSATCHSRIVPSVTDSPIWGICDLDCRHLASLHSESMTSLGPWRRSLGAATAGLSAAARRSADPRDQDRPRSRACRRRPRAGTLAPARVWSQKPHRTASPWRGSGADRERQRALRADQRAVGRAPGRRRVRAGARPPPRQPAGAAELGRRLAGVAGVGREIESSPVKV